MLEDKFDEKDLEISFREITHVRQTKIPEVYIFEFQNLDLMVINIYEARLILLFTKGLEDPLKGLVKSTDHLPCRMQ